MLKHERKKASDVQRSALTVASRTSAQPVHVVDNEPLIGQRYQSEASEASFKNGRGDLLNRATSEEKIKRQGTFGIPQSLSTTIDEGDTMKAKILGAMSLGRQEAFDIFMQEYNDRDKIEANKQFLKQRYTEAKALGEQLNGSKQKMNQLKNSLAQYRIHGELSGQGELEGETQMEIDIKKQMEEEKLVYKTTFMSLRSLKTEIEHMQHLLENLKVKLMKDFELWWSVQIAKSHPQATFGASHPGGVSQNFPQAWKSPAVTPSAHAHPSSQVSQRANSLDSLSSLKSDVDISGSSSRQTSASRPQSRATLGGLALTGDSKVDADIEAFVRARQTILRKVNASQR